MSRFLQIHTLTSYPASLLNRDDAGFAKRIPFGGTTRTRISSQCLKRHWRTFEGEDALSGLGVPMSVRSRYTFEELIVNPLIERDGVPRELARAVTVALMDEVLGKSEKAKKQEAVEESNGKSRSRKGVEPDAESAAPEANAAIQTGQITVLGKPEVDHLLEIARRVCAGKPAAGAAPKAVAAELGRDGKKNLATMKRGAGLDAALFGRMVTSDILARGDAAVHVAHAFTVHAEATESDYFSAVDDLATARERDGAGSGHIGNSELTSGLFYGYVVVDLPLLVSNLEGIDRKAWASADRELAGKVVERLVKLVAKVTPGAKLGSTAPYAAAHLVLVEAGNAQPRTLANAFLRPVVVSPSRPDLVENAYRAVAAHVSDLDRMYGAGFRRRLAGLGDVAGLAGGLKAGSNATLDELAAWASGEVRAG
jgi:CRISPR system Cascade subunit CasC